MRGVDLYEPEHLISYKFLPKMALALEETGDGFFVQTNRPKLYVTHTLLFLKRLSNEIIEFLNYCASKDFIILENISGLPEGFFCVKNVRFLKPIDLKDWDSQDPRYYLLPTETIQT